MIFFLLKASPLAAFACTGVVEGPPSLMTDGRPIVEKKRKKPRKKAFFPTEKEEREGLSAFALNSRKQDTAAGTRFLLC